MVEDKGMAVAAVKERKGVGKAKAEAMEAAAEAVVAAMARAAKESVRLVVAGMAMGRLEETTEEAGMACSLCIH